jgi:septum site-determining protein MinC
VTIAVRPRQSIRFRGRSFMALVLAPVAPLGDWLAEIDAAATRSPGFFSGRAVIIDVSAIKLDKSELTALISELHARDIRIMGIEGADASLLGLGLPPPVSGGKATSAIEMVDATKVPPPAIQAPPPA